MRAGRGGWAVSTARGKRNVGGLGDVELASRSYGGAADVVPASQLGHGDTETVGDGNEGVSAACAIEGARGP